MKNIKARRFMIAVASFAVLVSLGSSNVFAYGGGGGFLGGFILPPHVSPTPTPAAPTGGSCAFTETAAPGEGVWHLTVRAVDAYSSLKAQTFSPEVRFIVIDRLWRIAVARFSTQPVVLEVGQTITFTCEDVQTAISQEKVASFNPAGPASEGSAPALTPVSTPTPTSSQSPTPSVTTPPSDQEADIGNIFQRVWNWLFH